MRKITIFLSVILLAVAAFAQDTTLTVTSDGKVGIGTTNPIFPVHVVSQEGYLTERFTVSGNGPYYRFRRAQGTPDNPQPVSDGDLLGQITWNGFHPIIGYTGVVGSAEAAIYARVEGDVSQNSMPTSLYFATKKANNDGLAARLVIKNGNVGIGTTNPTHPLHMASGAHVTAGGVWTDASSRELKENIQELSVGEATSTLLELAPMKYNYKAEKNDQKLGFIAEDVPDLVATPDRKSLSPMDIVAVLTKVVQEQQTQIAKMQQEMNLLKNKIGE